MKTKILLPVIRTGWSFVCLMAMVAGTVAVAPAAVSFYIAPAGQAVAIGGTGEFELRASISNDSPEAIGDYDLTITYNPVIVQIDDFAFGSGLDLGTPGDSDQSLSSIAPVGQINLVEISFALPDDLIAGQPEDFVLATMQFTGLTPGVSPLIINTLGVSDADGFAIPPTSIATTNGSITVRDPGGNEVPETLGLLPAGLTLGLLLMWGTAVARRPKNDGSL